MQLAEWEEPSSKKRLAEGSPLSEPLRVKAERSAKLSYEIVWGEAVAELVEDVLASSLHTGDRTRTRRALRAHSFLESWRMNVAPFLEVGLCSP